MEKFNYKTYMIRRKFFKFFGSSFHIFNPDGEVVFFSKLKAFKLREDIRLFSDESMNEEILFLHSRKIIDFSSTYDVYDSKTNVKIGAFARKGLKSLLRDKWIILDKEDNPIGTIQEDSTALALVRRLLVNLIPQTFNCEVNGTPVLRLKQRFNPFIFKMDIELLNTELLDNRLSIAATLLLSAIEGRQN